MIAGALVLPLSLDNSAFALSQKQKKKINSLISSLSASGIETSALEAYVGGGGGNGGNGGNAGNGGMAAQVAMALAVGRRF